MNTIQTQQHNNTQFKALKGIKYNKNINPKKDIHDAEMILAFKKSPAFNEFF